MSVGAPQDKKILKSFGRFTLRHFLLLTMLPMIILLIGAGVVTFSLSKNVEQHTDTLARNTVTNVLTAQRGAVNLEGLRISLRSLVNAVDPGRAREAYINAWSLLSESSLDRHDATKESMLGLLASVQEVWAERQKYDAERHRIHEYWRTIYADLMTAFALGRPVAIEEMPPIQFNAMEHASYRDFDLAAHQQQVQDFKTMYEMVCSQKPVGSASTRQAFKERCLEVEKVGRELEGIVLNLTRVKDEFEASVDKMEAKTLALRTEYSAIETTQLIEDIKHINNITDPTLPAVILLGVVIALMLCVIFLGFYTLLKPLQQLIHEVHDFMDSDKIPENHPKSWVAEINETIHWLMRFCEMTKLDREEKRHIENQYSQLLTEATTDALTGVANRKALQDLVKKSTGKVQAATGVLMIDIDHFKNINDTRGHPFGDLILQSLGRQLKHHIRATDLIYRYGGEEFCIVMPDITEDSLVTAAHRLLATVHAISKSNASILPNGEAKDPLTISIGISSVTQDFNQKSLTELVAEADKALYAAKHAGRDCWRVFTEQKSKRTHEDLSDEVNLAQ